MKEINQKLKSNMDRTIEEIQKGLNVMKFDVVVGNPPIRKQELKTDQEMSQFITNLSN